MSWRGQAFSLPIVQGFDSACLIGFHNCLHKARQMGRTSAGYWVITRNQQLPCIVTLWVLGHPSHNSDINIKHPNFGLNPSRTHQAKTMRSSYNPWNCVKSIVCDFCPSKRQGHVNSQPILTITSHQLPPVANPNGISRSWIQMMPWCQWCWAVRAIWHFCAVFGHDYRASVGTALEMAQQNIRAQCN